jgi:hypothetical protein
MPLSVIYHPFLQTPFELETSKLANNHGHNLNFQLETGDVVVSSSKSQKPLQHSDGFEVSSCDPPKGEKGCEDPGSSQSPEGWEETL